MSGARIQAAFRSARTLWRRPGQPVSDRIMFYAGIRFAMDMVLQEDEFPSEETMSALERLNDDVHAFAQMPDAASESSPP